MYVHIVGFEYELMHRYPMVNVLYQILPSVAVTGRSKTVGLIKEGPPTLTLCHKKGPICDAWDASRSS